MGIGFAIATRFSAKGHHITCITRKKPDRTFQGNLYIEKSFSQSIPMNRMGHPSDVAVAIPFFNLKMLGFITNSFC